MCVFLLKLPGPSSAARSEMTMGSVTPFEIAVICLALTVLSVGIIIAMWVSQALVPSPQTCIPFVNRFVGFGVFIISGRTRLSAPDVRKGQERLRCLFIFRSKRFYFSSCTQEVHVAPRPNDEWHKVWGQSVALFPLDEARQPLLVVCPRQVQEREVL